MPEDLNKIVAEHSIEITNITKSLKSISEALTKLNDRMTSGRRMPIQAIISVVSLMVVIMMAFGAYFKGEIARQERVILLLRANNEEAIYEAGRQSVIYDQVMKIQDRQVEMMVKIGE